MDDNASGRWWHGAVLYQLYVRSWLDTDGDGYGDLNGVIAGLDYLSWLGVDGVWLSPTMPSPDQDWGYDVSDYLSVHPELGTLDDLDRLVAEAGARGMRVLLDLVPNHTSSAHPWFVDAAGGRDAAHRDYYVWADPAPDGGPPNNWLDATGHPAWAWHEPTGQYYLHNFLDSQPDLNWWEPAVHAEFREILGFWFDRGVAGFRIDVAQGLYKDAELRDNPPAEAPNPLEGRFGQRPVYSANRPESHAVFRDWRRIAEGYRPPRLLLGETWVDLAALAGFYGHGDELQLGFNFPFVFARFAARELSAVVGDTLEILPAGATPVWTASNHDVGRFPTRWCGGDERKIRLALLVLATLPGTTVLYYGDEIGMTDVAVPPELRRDKMTRDVSGRWNRDRGRTPMQWEDSPSGGFTADGVKPWLPVGDASARNVADQRQDPASVLAFCRRLLALRRAELAGRDAGYEFVPSAEGLWAYRVGGLTVAANLSDAPVDAPDSLAGEVLLSTTSGAPSATGVIGAWQGTIFRNATPVTLP
ncbi:MAG TPA: alpha-amylase family glycosyl hydrolase [Streptosporangiaceae bacterium]|nr:alpha-amylase family glycosyl hydrolase [Streptosporangiaceae bacterium]